MQTWKGNGKLDFYSTKAEFDASWTNINLTSGSANFTGGDDYEVWIPFMKNHETNQYEYVIYFSGQYNFNSGRTLNGSSLWSPGYPSQKAEDCVVCGQTSACYDAPCSQTVNLHKCKFVTMNFLHMQGLCDKTALGSIFVLIIQTQ